MTFRITIPGPTGETEIQLAPGNSLWFVGANGGGKTRLAVRIEQNFRQEARRISAHRALTLNLAVNKVSEEQARRGLSDGGLTPGHNRDVHRWKGQAAVALLNDFDYLVQALFAEQTNITFINHAAARRGEASGFAPTKLEELAEIWHRLLPHRTLILSGDDIRVRVGASSESYSAQEMSDGERATFYLIGQVLIAEPNMLLIFDEPELHIHRSITGKLWDELEAARPDCAFVIITHDLEFAAARVGQKFVIREYSPQTNWTIEEVPDETGFDEETATAILGSRRPVLFTEGTGTSLDRAIYRACYPEWTVIPRGSCEEVIHSVVTMRRNAALTRVTCSGLVDADDYESGDVARLEELGVGVLSVAEIENLILLPNVSRTIAEHEGLRGTEVEERLEALRTAVFSRLEHPGELEASVMQHCRRRIDRALKQVDLSAAGDVAALAEVYREKTQALDIAGIAEAARALLNAALTERDLPRLLSIYSNKGMISLAATHLKRTRKDDFENWLARILRNDQAPAVKEAIRDALPELAAS